MMHQVTERERVSAKLLATEIYDCFNWEDKGPTQYTCENMKQAYFETISYK